MEKKKLRSNVEPGSVRWTARLAEWSVFGITEDDLEKPKIAVVNSSSTLAACFAHLDDIAAKLMDEIRAAGGLPFEIRTAASSDFITSMGKQGGYILPTRDLIVNDVEVAVEGAQLDGMICLVSCDKTIPGLMMAAARLNIPTIVIACGYQPSGYYKGKPFDIEDLWLETVRHQAGVAHYSLDELREMSKQAILGPGACSGMGTANSMHIVTEALGMALPGSAPVLANSEKMWTTVSKAAKRIIELVWEDVKPRDILTEAAFENAVKVALSISGSINCIKHLQAIAHEAELDVDVYSMFEKYCDEVPLLAAVRPNGNDRIEEFEKAGGAIAVMKQLEGMLQTEAITITGKTVEENLADVTVKNEEVIRPLHNPFANRPSIVIVRGTLAPQTGIVKLAIADDRPLSFTGPAIVFESAEEAIAAVHENKVKEGHVVVVRGIGPKGAPGMGLASSVAFALDSVGLSGKIAFVTDGQQSGLSNVNLSVNEVSPEAAEGGPIALVENGDIISIDVKNKVVNLEVSEDELNARRRVLHQYLKKEERGWLAVYKQLVQPLPATGGAFKFKQ